MGYCRGPTARRVGWPAAPARPLRLPSASQEKVRSGGRVLRRQWPQIETRIGGALQQLVVVGDEQDHRALAGAAPDGVRDRVQVTPVHARARLVVDHDPRSDLPGTGDDHPLALSGRQRVLLGEWQKIELVEQSVDIADGGRGSR